MEFSYVDGQRRKPEPGLKGVCGLCGGKTVSKCGNIRLHHWSHWRRQNCDPWWENETEWHREWKSEFPEHCREVSVTSNDGKKHRADVKTDCGRVIEIQHSIIKAEDRRIREAFYKDMAWVVNGLRRESFRESFDTQLNRAKVLENTPIKLRLLTGNCTILKTWADSEVSVYMDFGDKTFTDDRFKFSKPILWRLCPVSSRSHVELIPVWREVFVNAGITGSSINGIHDPEMTVTGKAENMEESPKYDRQESESDLEYSLRVWGIDGIDKEQNS